MTKFHHEIIEATRLTRAGRLVEATRLIRALLHKNPTKSGADTTQPADHSDVSVAGLIDIAPSSIDESRPVCHDQRQAATHIEPEQLPLQPNPITAPKTFLQRFTRDLSCNDGGALGVSMPHVLRQRGHRPRPEPVPALPKGARILSGTFGNRAGQRDYKLFIPSRYDNTPMPLVVMLHGCAQSPDDIAAGTRMNEIAEAQGTLVVYPAQASSANQSCCWNWFQPDHQRRDEGEPAIIAGIAHDVAQNYAIDHHRIYVTGMSAGGAAAVVLGATYPDVFAAVGVHSGLPAGAAKDLPSALAAMRLGVKGTASTPSKLVPTIVFHGDKDATVNPANGVAIIAQARRASPELLVETQQGEVPGGRAWSRTLHLDRDGRVRLEMWHVHGTGHAWSGGSTAGSFTDPLGPNASREMMRFFQESVPPLRQ